MKNINLLTEGYRTKSETYRETKVFITAAAVIFLLWILLVTISSSMISLMDSRIYANEAALANPEAKEAERLNRLAARAADMSNTLSFPENISPVYLSAVAEEGEGITISELLLDNGEGCLSVSGTAASEELLTDFTARLGARKYFSEIAVTELEYRGGAFVFLLELRIGDGL